MRKEDWGTEHGPWKGSCIDYMDKWQHNQISVLTGGLLSNTYYAGSTVLYNYIQWSGWFIYISFTLLSEPYTTKTAHFRETRSRRSTGGLRPNPLEVIFAVFPSLFVVFVTFPIPVIIVILHACRTICTPHPLGKQRREEFLLVILHRAGNNNIRWQWC